MYVERNTKARSRNHSYRVSECVFVVLVIQHAKRMRRIILSVACLTLPHFFHIISQTARFSEKQLLNINSVFWFSAYHLSETFLILRIQRDIITNVHKCSCKVPAILVRFWSNVNFIDRFSKKPSNTKMGVQLFHTSGQTGGQTRRS